MTFTVFLLAYTPAVQMQIFIDMHSFVKDMLNIFLIINVTTMNYY